MVRMTRSMPKRLTDATLYSSSMHGDSHSSPRANISNEDYFIMMKRMNELEEKVTILSKRPSTMPPEKEEMLNNALKRIDMLEQELSATKKVTETPPSSKQLKPSSKTLHPSNLTPVFFAVFGGCSGPTRGARRLHGKAEEEEEEVLCFLKKKSPAKR